MNIEYWETCEFFTVSERKKKNQINSGNSNSNMINNAIFKRNKLRDYVKILTNKFKWYKSFK